MPPRTSMPGADSCPERAPTDDVDSDDEGMGDEEDSSDDEMQPDDSGFASMDVEAPLPSPSSAVLPVAGPSHQVRSSRTRHSAPSALSSPATRPHLRPNYKLLHQTHVRLRNRFTAGSYTLSNLQTRGTPNSHSNTIYCLQLYTYPETGTQVLFTGSKDRTIREWDLATGAVRVRNEVCVAVRVRAGAGECGRARGRARGRVREEIHRGENQRLCQCSGGVSCTGGMHCVQGALWGLGEWAAKSPRVDSSKYISFRLYRAGRHVVAPWKVVATSPPTRRTETRKTRGRGGIRAAPLLDAQIARRTAESCASAPGMRVKPCEEGDVLPSAFAQALRAQTSRNPSSRN